MTSNQNAAKRNIISFTIAFTIAMVAMTIQNSKEKSLIFKDRLEASVPQNGMFLFK